jgi:hypothetical protein
VRRCVKGHEWSPPCLPVVRTRPFNSLNSRAVSLNVDPEGSGFGFTAGPIALVAKRRDAFRIGMS